MASMSKILHPLCSIGIAAMGLVIAFFTYGDGEYIAAMMGTFVCGSALVQAADQALFRKYQQAVAEMAEINRTLLASKAELRAELRAELCAARAELREVRDGAPHGNPR